MISWSRCFLGSVIAVSFWAVGKGGSERSFVSAGLMRSSYGG